MMTPLAALSFMILNLFDPPCLVAMVTIAREMGDKMWAAIALGFQLVLGYCLAFSVYQLGGWLFYGMPLESVREWLLSFALLRCISSFVRLQLSGN